MPSLSLGTPFQSFANSAIIERLLDASSDVGGVTSVLWHVGSCGPGARGKLAGHSGLCGEGPAVFRPKGRVRDAGRWDTFLRT